MKVLKFISYLVIALVVSFYVWNPVIEDVHKYVPSDVPTHLIPETLTAIDVTFGVCVYIIYEVGKMFDLSYNATNIWLFVVIMPSMIVILFLNNIILRRKIRKLTDHTS
jgi:hypothetical protein